MGVPDAYKADVIDLGDNVSQCFYNANKLTWEGREGLFGEIVEGTEHFRGDRVFHLGPLLGVPEPEKLEFTQESDGIGTKVLVAQRVGRYDTVAFDLVAMVCDDAAARGFEPISMTTDLQVNSLKGFDVYIEQLLTGAVKAVRTARVALLGGETAVVGKVIGGHDNPNDELWFSWSGTVLGVRHQDRKVDGSKIEPGMPLIGFRERGFRSNGITQVRETLGAWRGDWHKLLFEDEDGATRSLGETVLTPSTIYTPVLVDSTGGYDLRRKPKAALQGVAHITGGGIPGKLGDLLGVTGYGAWLHSPFDVPKVMKEVLDKAGMSDEAGYNKFHMGQGMVVASWEAEEVIGVAVEHGIEAKEIGRVTKEAGVKLKSTGNQTNTRIEFDIAA